MVSGHGSSHVSRHVPGKKVHPECGCVKQQIKEPLPEGGQALFWLSGNERTCFPTWSDPSLLPLAPAEQDDIALSTNGVIS